MTAPEGPNKTRFAGYAAVFDRTDRGGDVIRKGAFQPLPAAVPLYWQHNPGQIAGRVEMIAEDAKGLRVIGATDKPVAAGTGLSFGYRIRAASEGATARELTALELVEISLVKQPMQPLARVHAVEG